MVFGIGGNGAGSAESARGIETLHIADAATVVQRTRTGGAVDMRTGRNNFRLDARALDRAARGERDHIHRVIGTGVIDGTTVGPQTIFIARAIIFGGANGQDIFRRARCADGLRTATGATFSKHKQHALLTGSGGIGVAHCDVVGARFGIAGIDACTP